MNYLYLSSLILLIATALMGGMLAGNEKNKLQYLSDAEVMVKGFSVLRIVFSILAVIMFIVFIAVKFLKLNEGFPMPGLFLYVALGYISLQGLRYNRDTRIAVTTDNIGMNGRLYSRSLVKGPFVKSSPIGRSCIIGIIIIEAGKEKQYPLIAISDRLNAFNFTQQLADFMQCQPIDLFNHPK